MGLVYTTHICGGTAVLSELGIGQSDIHCGGKTKSDLLESICENKNHAISKKPCCENSILSIQLDDKFQKPTLFELQFIPFSFVFLFNYSLEEYDQKIPSKYKIGYVRTKDIPIWNQSFLI